MTLLVNCLSPPGRSSDGWRTMANVEPKSLLLSMNHLLVHSVVIYASLSGCYLEIAIFVFVCECVCLKAVCILRVRDHVCVCCLSLDYWVTAFLQTIVCPHKSKRQRERQKRAREMERQAKRKEQRRTHRLLPFPVYVKWFSFTFTPIFLPFNSMSFHIICHSLETYSQFGFVQTTSISVVTEAAGSGC